MEERPLTVLVLLNLQVEGDARQLGQARTMPTRHSGLKKAANLRKALLARAVRISARSGVRPASHWHEQKRRSYCVVYLLDYLLVRGLPRSHEDKL